MVKYQDGDVSRTFAALGDPTRRAIVERLSQGPATVSELAEPFDMSLPAVSKHLGILEDAGLIARSREGRIRRCFVQPEALEGAAEWINTYKRFWEGQFDALARYLERTADDVPEIETPKRKDTDDDGTGSTG